MAVFHGQHCLVCACDGEEEWVYSLVEELYFARNCQQISKISVLLVSDVRLDFEKITIAS